MPLRHIALTQRAQPEKHNVLPCSYPLHPDRSVSPEAMASMIAATPMASLSAVRAQRPSAALSASRIARVQPRQMHVARASPVRDLSLASSEDVT